MRTKFLTAAGALGMLIGLVALLAPAAILTAKGVDPAPAPMVWVREVGALIIATSVVVLLVRRHADSPTLRALFWGNALVHVGLLPIEIVALHGGVITRLDGIAPNTLLHVAFATAFAVLAARTRVPAPRPGHTVEP